MYPKRKKQKCGQLAIFIALIFQLVFILFAMSLNVALVVHDKINLQNSVDLAAYYGAMKQAQTLNAIAHINYQIRQSWKLLAWRYRVLGNPYAAKQGHPREQENLQFDPKTGSPDIYIVCTGAFDAGKKKGWGTFRLPGGSGADELWTPKSGADYGFCTNIRLDISALRIPNASSFLKPLVNAIISTAKTGNKEITRKCLAICYTNWLFAFFSFYHFRVDQSRKAKLIYKIADKIAGDGMEIEKKGNIESGARQTFMSNLTYINRQAYDSNPNSFQVFNSLQGQPPDNWLSSESFYAYPPLYVKTTGEPGDCSGKGTFINDLPDNVTDSSLIQLATNDLIGYSNNRTLCKETGSNNFCESSAGLTKKDDFIVYFGAKAELEYKNQIFLPFFKNNKLRLKAQGFAKPFGGRIGPKFEDDKTLPRLAVGTMPTERQVSKWSPNYAKYPGDEFGLASHYVQRQWAERIYNATSTFKNIENYIPGNFPNLPNSPLSKDTESKQWELAAVAPDLFDVTYFTILPSYMDTYYKNLQAWDFNPPEDFGGGIKQQVSGTGVWPVPALNPNMNKPFYVIKDLSNLLTGWNPPKEKYTNTGEYPADENKTTFAKCDKWDYQLDDDGDARLATGCVTGGRTGYSVKMINKEHLQTIISGGLTPEPSGSDWNW